MVVLMKRIVAVWVCGWALVVASVSGSAQTMKPAKPAGAAPKVAYYIDPAAMELPALIPDPPDVDSATNKAELAELHRIESTRTPEQLAAAKADDAEEDM